MANTSILAAFERMWQHIVVALSEKSNINHTHEVDDFVNFPSSMPADGGNADTLGGRSAAEFASASDVNDLKEKVGTTPVSDQINAAVAQKSQVQIITWEVDD